MSETMQEIIDRICGSCDNDRRRMLDIVTEVQKKMGCVSGEAMEMIAGKVSVQRIDVESVVSFFSFLSKEKKGDVIIRVCNDVVDNMLGSREVIKEIEDELKIKCGQTTSDGKITLEQTPCIGMSDQAPAMLVNDMVMTALNPSKARKIAQNLKKGIDLQSVFKDVGDGNNADKSVLSMVKNNIKKKGEVLFAQRDKEAGLKKSIMMTPVNILEELKTSELCGRGGAGFPTGLKWEFTRMATGDTKYIICNADEGEPGTFKDRVLLTEKYDLLFEGMTIAGYAIGAENGILYLRAEYAYLRELLEQGLRVRREQGLLGGEILGKEGFNFDIRIQTGAGAYICGEETALISSAEGLRGDPKNRPPFPAEKGYDGCPTTVNNVETFCCVSRIIERGSTWFSEIGSDKSNGTKLLSVSGDCRNPGVYEYEFGVKLNEVLKTVGAENTQAVLVGGPSGQFIAEDGFDRVVCYDDLATGGSIVIFNKDRNILEAAKEYMDFFVDESCGYCTPCRVGNVLMRNCLENINSGKGSSSDFDYLEGLGNTIKMTSRCGLGQTSPNPILTTLKNFKKLYENVINKEDDGFLPSFDIKEALKDGEALAGRPSVNH